MTVQLYSVLTRERLSMQPNSRMLSVDSCLKHIRPNSLTRTGV